MSILHLRTFVEVYRQASLSRAAEELGLTQPAVSNHIASLEAQIERPLFIRHAKGVRPTDIADDLAAQLRDTLDHAENALARIKARSAEISGTVHVNGPIDMLSSLLAPRLGPLLDLGIRVRMHPADRDTIFSGLADGVSDFSLGLRAPDDPKLDHCVLGEEEVHLVMAPQHAERLGADLEVALPAFPMLAYDLERSLIRNWLSHNGLFLGRADEAITAPDLRCLRELALAGFGWTVLPGYLVAEDLSAGRLAAVKGPLGSLHMNYFLCWRVSSMRSPRSVRVRSEIVKCFQAD